MKNTLFGMVGLLCSLVVSFVARSVFIGCLGDEYNGVNGLFSNILQVLSLAELGFARTQVYTTMELRMKCGVGKCGRCNIGSKYVCKDGPVFRMDQLDELPDEY